jgi:hypothetical protein
MPQDSREKYLAVIHMEMTHIQSQTRCYERKYHKKLTSGTYFKSLMSGVISDNLLLLQLNLNFRGTRFLCQISITFLVDGGVCHGCYYKWFTETFTF